jgi:NhaP-type Na+/H+ or K+/H+ antiporter
MSHESLTNPALTIALALAAGIVVQALARHLRLPGIVLLLGTGAVLGPDVFNIIQPQTLGSALHMLIGFAVAVVLFEGGMNLNLSRLRHESGTIQRLVTIGALVTAVGGSLTARYVLGWDWHLAFLFGTLVIVTGPTVVTPLIKRIRLTRNLETVLEAEGVLIDPIGAIIAVVALEIVIAPSSSSFTAGLWGAGAKLAVGIGIGAAAGLLIALLLRPKRLVPEGLENVLTLSLVLALFHVSDAIQSESGIVAVTAAGLVVGNIRTRALRDLMEFKEQLTVMFIGMLFVLLAADVRFAEITALGTPGLIAVAVLMFVVRPVNVIASTIGSSLKAREKVFLSWLAPRGIVAAAVASFFAGALTEAGMPGGDSLRAMTFLVIAITVLVQGLTGGLVASGLGVRRKGTAGIAILGAHDLARTLGQTLREFGEEVVLLDSNADAINAAKEEGFRVVFGNALEERTLQRAGLDGAASAIGLTPNEGLNLLFIQRAREEYKIPNAWSVMGGHVTAALIQDAGAHVLFGSERDIDLWSIRLRRGLAQTERWQRSRLEKRDWPDGQALPEAITGALLPLVLRRGSTTVLVDENTEFKEKDELVLIVFSEKREDANRWLVAQGWMKIEETELAKESATAADEQ